MMDHNLDALPDLPPELAALDAELGALRIEERASFGPELEAELRRASASAEPFMSSPFARVRRRLAIAASIAVLMCAVAVPPARASLVALIGQLEMVLPQVTVVLPDVVLPVESPRDEQITLMTVKLPEEMHLVSTASLVGRPEAADPFRPARVVSPHLVDVDEVRSAIRHFYPRHLQEDGIGGTVNLLVYVDSAGAAHQTEIGHSSMVPELDEAALEAASGLRFRAATRDGKPFGMWVQFDLVFEPLAETPGAVDRPALPAPSPIEPPPEWLGYGAMPAPIMQETLQLLHGALGDDAVVARLGSLEGVVHGDPPAGADPVQWRADAARALENAIQRNPDNPAPFLALARIRRKQGLPAEERALLERGAQRAQQGGLTVSPRLTAELEYELATVAKDAGRPFAHLGRLPADALDGVTCERAGVAKDGEQIGPDLLIAWNYVCPDVLRRVLDERFEEVTPGDERETMLRSLRAAVAADPAHVGANVELLLDLADRGDATALLNGARRFGAASGGHPYARLLAGLALQRMGHDEDALKELNAGLAGLSNEEREGIRDVTPLLDVPTAQRFLAMGPADRARFETAFWAPLDPILSTDVNERYVAHLARSVYADLRWGGTQSDAGLVWVRYGEPLSVRAFGEGTPLRTELWDYGQGAAIAFRRPAASATLDLTPEARAYLNDLRSAQPYPPGLFGRTVAPLGAEVSRFRDKSGTPELEVVTRVPAALGGSGDVDVAVVQVGGNGDRIDVDHDHAKAGSVLRLRVRAKGGAQQLAVELVNPTLERAATLRTPFGPAASADARASDLELMRPAARPRRDVERDARWLDPMPDEQIVGSEVGALFELYGVPGNGAYQLRVELAPAAGGAPIALEFRPAGESRFGQAFTRSRWPDAGRVTEFLTARIPDGLAPGRYLLRARADFGSGAALVAQRSVNRP